MSLADRTALVRIVFGGDVMIGRGVDQVLPHPCPPHLYESYATSATDYVELAEAAHGPIPKPVPPAYVWGDALDDIARLRPDAVIVNLETAITRSEAAERKGINYRVSPENAACLTAAPIDCCTLANNHVLDWGAAGLADTLRTLRGLRIRTAGAGDDLAQARAPAGVECAGARVLVFSFAHDTSGVPRRWAATETRAGIAMLPDLSDATADRIGGTMRQHAEAGDIILASIHWGSNWGYDVADDQRRFACRLVEAGVAVVHGHSSHHPRPIEVAHDRLIVYGCGDLINDYEGIAGYEDFRGDLVLLYAADLALRSGRLHALRMIPLRIERFRLRHAAADETAWLQTVLDRESRAFGSRVHIDADGWLRLSWQSQAAIRR